MNKTKSIVVAALVACAALAACDQNGSLHRSPGRVYAPDMTYSRAYDAYTEGDSSIFKNGLVSQPSVPGTIARGHQLPDHLTEGDTTAYKTFTTSLRFSDAETKEGGRLYLIYCGICHGQNLDGNGPLYNDGGGKFAAAPANFKLAKYMDMPDGTMYGAIKYGKNMMGSYASQLDVKQRWQVIAYIRKVQSENGGQAFRLGTTTMANDSASAKAMTPNVGEPKHQ